VRAFGVRSGSTLRDGDSSLRGGEGVVLSLVPLSDRRQIGLAATIRATLTENGAPMEGRTVRFLVTGANEATGEGVTDAAGEVEFSYSGVFTGVDTVLARFETPTRFYLSSTAAPVAVAGSGEWEFKTNAENVRGTLSTASDGSVLGDRGTTAVDPTPSADHMVYQGVSEALPGGEISGFARGMVRVRETAARGDMRTQVIARVVSGDGTTVRGVLFGPDPAGALEDEWPTGYEARRLPRIWADARGAPISTVVAQTGDRIVLEVGFRIFASYVGSETGYARIGAPNGVADLEEAEGAQGDLRPWVEFSSVAGAETSEAEALIEWVVLGGGGGLRRVLSGEVVHQIVSPRGVSRWPVVGDFDRLDSGAGGWKSAKGKISRAEFEAAPDVYRAGSEWFVWERGTGRLLFRSDLTEPTPTGGAVDISGRGPGAVLDKDAPRLLFSAVGGSEAGWTNGADEPFGFDTSKKIGVEVQEGGIRWKIENGKTFAGGEISRAIFYAEGFDGLSRLSWKLKGKDANYGNLEVVLRGRNIGEAGDYAAAATDIATWSLGAGGPAEGTILEQAITDDYDLIELGLRATGAFTAGDDIEIAARRLVVGGISDDDDTTADDVFAEVFDRIGCDSVRIEPSGVPVGAVDHISGSWASLLDAMALRTDYYYRVYWEGGKLVGEAGTWGKRRYTVFDPELSDGLIPLEPFDRVKVAFTYPNGAPGSVTVKATGRTLAEPNLAPTIRITGRTMDDETAELTGGLIADRLVVPRWSGAGKAHEVYDSNGYRVHANIVDAGDLLYYPHAGAEVRVGEVSGGEGPPSFKFTEGIPFLDRLTAKLGLE
jgi:hypothetical protein